MKRNRRKFSLNRKLENSHILNNYGINSDIIKILD